MKVIQKFQFMLKNDEVGNANVLGYNTVCSKSCLKKPSSCSMA